MTPVMPQIMNVVFLMLENRSLDNVLGWLYDKRALQHVYPAGSPVEYDGLVVGRYHNPAHSINRVIGDRVIRDRPRLRCWQA